MKRYYKGSDIPFRLSIKDKNGKVIPLACFDSLEVVFRTTGEQYTKYYKGGGITENEDGTYRIYANENAFGLLPDGLLKYTVSFTLNGVHQEIKECETDIFIKTPKQFQPKANVQDKSITVIENNSVSKVIPDGGYEGLGEVTVNVEIPFPLEVKEVSITENNSTSLVIPDGGYEGLGEVTVNVEIPFPMEIKEVNITENESTTTITTGEGYSGMSEVNVNVKVPITIKLPNGIKFGYSNITKFPDGFDLSEITDVTSMFIGTKIKDLSNLDIGGKPTSMEGTFQECRIIEKYPKINTSEVTNITSCFYYNLKLTECPYDFPKVSNAYGAFRNSGIKTIPDFIYNATDIRYAFENAAIEEIGDVTFQASNLNQCFHDCKSLTRCGVITIANATRAQDFLNRCDNLEYVGGIVSPTLTDITGMFAECKRLTYIGDFDCPELTSIYGFIWNSSLLTKAPSFNSTKLYDIHQAYTDCVALEEIPSIVCTNVTSTFYYVHNCPALTTVGALQNLKVSIDFSSSPLLTVESLMNIINGLATASATLTLGSANLAKLSDEQKAVATNKGWTLA